MNTKDDLDRRIKAIQEKLFDLKALDKRFSLFGAAKHQYLLNDTLPETTLQAFERKFNIHLPEDYRTFLKLIGNGGAGPYYGLQTLEDSLFADLDRKKPDELVDPSAPFPLTEPWLIKFQGDEDNEDDADDFLNLYYDPKWDAGLLRICNFGCGISINLIVNGGEHGNIWIDDRCNEGGIYPDPYFSKNERITFLQWYELWLEASLNEIKGNL